MAGNDHKLRHTLNKALPELYSSLTLKYVHHHSFLFNVSEKLNVIHLKANQTRGLNCLHENGKTRDARGH
jgi:hypothetical protein